ncbi:MAG: cytochrome ubiquinol oxidase subunit I [Nocardiopsaceae bacterium]|nr:cytochrome ubiquinol oxidase subunit I [Nocardiopsaceae bacterium]
MSVTQHYLFEARQMQALSLAVHIPLVCFGIAFPVLVLYAEYRYLRSGDLVYRAVARRWSRIMLALFAVGVVTGTILSFEMGLLWPQWMRDFGNVFGLGFTLEGFSFFVEAIFVGIYAYGWDRLSPRLHFASGIPVAVAGVAGSFFVIAVNAWMNHPTGFTLADGRAANVHPWRALFANPQFASEYVHMYFAAYIVCGFLLAGAYAVSMLRGRRGPYQRAALRISLSAAAVAAPLQVIVGDWAARDVATYQPVKLAAIEGLATTTRGAAEHLLGLYDGHAVVWGVQIPKLLSLLAFHNPNAVVKGLNIVPLADQPPVNVVRFSFQTMVGIGTLLALIGLVYLFLRWRRRRLPRLLLWAVAAAGPLSVVALIAGWITTEVGRQPWIVYEVMRVNAAVTGASDIPIGYGTLSVVYLALAVIVWVILRRIARVPLPPELAEETRGSQGVSTNGLRSRRLHPGRDGRVHGPGRRGLRRGPVDAAGPGARGAREVHPRPRAARDGAGVGGQPRLADLRAGGVLDGLPGGLRVDHVHAGRADADRRDRDHLPRRRLRAARHRGLGLVRRGPARHVVGPDPVRDGHGGGRHRPGPGPGRERGREPGDLLAQPGVRPHRAAVGRVLGLPGRRLPRGRRPPAG